MHKRIDRNKVLENIIINRTKDRLEKFRQYTLEIELKFNFDQNELSNRYTDAVKGLPSDKAREIEEYFYDDYYIIEKIYIAMYRKSTLASIYSFLEVSMNRICTHLNSKHDYPVDINDLKDNGIVRAKNYLEKLAKVNFNKLNGEWSDLRDFNKIRNCIIHSEGNIKNSRNETKLKNIINNTQSLSLYEERNIEIDREYIDFIIDRIEKFLEKLHQQVF